MPVFKLINNTINTTTVLLIKVDLVMVFLNFKGYNLKRITSSIRMTFLPVKNED